MPADLGRMIGDYRGLIAVCRARAEELEISRIEIDRLSGLPSGYSAKLLGKGNGANPRRMFPASLESILGTLGLKLMLIEDADATARTLSRREPVNSRQQRFDNVSRLTAKLLAPPATRPPSLRIVAGGRKSRAGKYG